MKENIDLVSTSISYLFVLWMEVDAQKGNAGLALGISFPTMISSFPPGINFRNQETDNAWCKVSSKRIPRH